MCFIERQGIIGVATAIALLGAGSLCAEDPWSKQGMKVEQLPGIDVRVSEPVVVAGSAPGETRWGFHQFPTISRLPDGRLLVTYNDCPDRDDAYGKPGPAFVSSDTGVTWEKWQPPDPFLGISHSTISEVYDGQYLCVPMSPSLDIEKNKVKLPPVAGTINVYGEVLLYNLAGCSSDVQTFVGTRPCVRWIPKEGKWRRESVAWETKGALIRTRKNDYVIPTAYLDNRIVRLAGALFYAVFHQQYLLPDGSLPKNYACWCMISKDNGRTWQRHGLIAHDNSGKLMMGEPCLLPTADGGLACVIRCADHRQKPMLIAYSADKGRTWSDAKRLYDFGVMPQGMLLANGVAVLSFGRPGVHLMFSPDGSAREWTGPMSIIPGDPKAIAEHSCGYTRLLPVSDNGFLMVYSYFKHAGKDARLCKAILVRKVVVARRQSTANKPDAGDGN